MICDNRRVRPAERKSNLESATHLKASTPSTHHALLFIQHDIIIQHLTVPLGCIIIPKDLQRSDDLDAWGARWDEDDGVSLVGRRVLGIAQAWRRNM